MQKLLFVFAFLLSLTACGEPDTFSADNDENKVVEISADCDPVQELAKCAFMVMAGADFANGGTISVTVNKIGGGFNRAYLIDRENQPIIPGSDGSYEFLNARYYPPIVPSISSRSLVQVASPVTVTIEAPNRSTATLRFRNLDADGDGRHDYIDPCPADPSNTCSSPGSVTTSTTTNDANNDGCDDTLWPVYGSCTTPGGTTAPTGVTIPTTWDPSQWYVWTRGVSNVRASTYNDPVYGSMVTVTVRAGLAASDDQKLHLIDGPATAGANRRLSGDVICNRSGVINSTVQNANSPWNAVSGYYSTTVTANALVRFSYAYTVLNTVSSKEVQHELGQMPAGAGCRFRYLTDQ